MDGAHRDLAVVAISIDCADHDSLAAFYARLLNGRVDWRTDGAAGVRAGSLHLIAQRVTDYRPPAWPGTSIVHLDLSCRDIDLAAQTAYAIDCGATAAVVQPDPRWVVMLDPAGHPFCLTPFTPPK
ncbi:MAG: VOC family protein [Microlunatus sp.]|nr:VOC family protein [Microlunatus sp.]